TGLEVKATVSGADTTHFVAADATSYNHTAAPLATFVATTLTATQGDHRAHARLTLTGGTLSQALTVGYQVRGQFSGGTTPWSTTANGRRATGTISRAWEYASLANPTSFATLPAVVCATSNTSCNDTAASPLGVKRLYRATLSAPGATSLTTNTMEGWRLAFTYVDGGYGFTCAVDTGGRLWAWGGSQPTPHIRATGPFVDCSTGGEDLGQIIIASGTVCARSAAGDVAFGSLKDANALVPRTDLGTGVKSIQLGPLHACAVKADGQAVCWGQNFTGGVGDNTTEDRTSPATVVRWNGVALTGVVEVAVGTYHSCARTGGGSVWCWGFNGTGGLGDGSGTDRHHAVQVPNISSAVGLALGGGLFATHSCVLLSNGETRCFGSNTDGQLG
ncbi:MAG TPA: hypothetical protein PK095_12680, partial [Myxococcota bacterium]|nr:hypothetical protein [Myxococcota bacterium]